MQSLSAQTVGLVGAACTQSTGAPPPSPMQAAHNSLWTEIDGLQGDLQALATKLSPVLAPAGPNPSHGATEEHPVEVVATIQRMALSVMEARQRVEDLLQRLAV